MAWVFFMEASFILVSSSSLSVNSVQNYIAAHQAAMSFSSVLYMLPLSFSLALTIIIGIEVGAKRYLEAKKYAYLGLIVSFLCVLSIVGLVFYFRDYIALLYATDTTLLTYIAHFFNLYCNMAIIRCDCLSNPRYLAWLQRCKSCLLCKYACLLGYLLTFRYVSRLFHDSRRICLLAKYGTWCCYFCCIIIF